MYCWIDFDLGELPRFLWLSSRENVARPSLATLPFVVQPSKECGSPIEGAIEKMARSSSVLREKMWLENLHCDSWSPSRLITSEPIKADVGLGRGVRPGLSERASEKCGSFVECRAKKSGSLFEPIGKNVARESRVLKKKWLVSLTPPNPLLSNPLKATSILFRVD